MCHSRDKNIASLNSTVNSCCTWMLAATIECLGYLMTFAVIVSFNFSNKLNIVYLVLRNV